jgi:PTS system ascorbate-specific IIA component
MNHGILIIAHAPLATALRQCVLHVFPEVAPELAACDVQPNVPPEETLAGARLALDLLGTEQTLILTDLFGATPCNIAEKLIDGPGTKLITGVNLPMLLRAVTYRHEPIEALVARALAGGTQGVMQVAATAPQNQVRRRHEHSADDHQQ